MKTNPTVYVDNIRRSGKTIYDTIEVGDPNLWIPAPALEVLLSSSLKGISLTGLPLRTRSKRCNELICKALGYPIPNIFKRTKPRFPGQYFDKYVQKRNNLQVWNDELGPTRRYVIIRLGADDVVTGVKVVSGATLSLLDTTGMLTQKYQARLTRKDALTELVTSNDTALIQRLTASVDLSGTLPTENPTSGVLLPIAAIYEKLKGLVGARFPDRGHDQERRRGADLHQLVCKQLGYRSFADDGQFPDLRNQLLEVKLQTSPTIDLGLVCPDSKGPLDIPMLEGYQLRHCDVRYALFYAEIRDHIVQITNFFLTTGESFFTRFPQFGGKVLNKKLQIPLPANFFDR